MRYVPVSGENRRDVIQGGIGEPFVDLAGGVVPAEVLQGRNITLDTIAEKLCDFSQVRVFIALVDAETMDDGAVRGPPEIKTQPTRRGRRARMRSGLY